MEIFYSEDIRDDVLCLDADETAHCMQVLRHKAGDSIKVIDGRGALYHCILLDEDYGGLSEGKGKAAKGAKGSKANRKRGPEKVWARIEGSETDWGGHPYHLTLAVCPTKNLDRYEWMAEKLTELGIDVLAPVIGERSERRVLKLDRLKRILLSATKQSLKGAIPTLTEPKTVMEFIKQKALENSELADSRGGKNVNGSESACTDNVNCRKVEELRLIGYCSDEVHPRTNIMEEIKTFLNDAVRQNGTSLRQDKETLSSEKLQQNETSGDKKCSKPKIVILIGPEGDFSPDEVRAAMAAGFIPITLGSSRFRIETAALTAAQAVYLSTL